MSKWVSVSEYLSLEQFLDVWFEVVLFDALGLHNQPIMQLA